MNFNVSFLIIKCKKNHTCLYNLSWGNTIVWSGLENCFIWDDKHGFGFNKDGEVVIVRPNASTGTSPTVTEIPVFSSEDLNIPCKFTVHNSWAQTF